VKCAHTRLGNAMSCSAAVIPSVSHRGVTSRTLMRPPVVKRQTLPKSGFCPFFPLCLGQAPSSSGNVFSLGFSRLARPSGGCTTHFLRVYRHRHGDGREPMHGFLRPRNLSVPSYRPTQKRGCPSLCASEAQVRVRGSTPSPRVALAVCTGAEAGVQSNAQGQGTAPMCSGAFADAGGVSWPRTVVRLTPW
jgi:hypothetical protein